METSVPTVELVKSWFIDSHIRIWDVVGDVALFKSVQEMTDQERADIDDLIDVEHTKKELTQE